MLGAFGLGGPSVDTVLTESNGRPGGTLTGHVNLVGGSHDVEIEHITLGLITRVEVEGGEMVDLPRWMLPAGAREGAVLVVRRGGSSAPGRDLDTLLHRSARILGVPITPEMWEAQLWLPSWRQ